MTPKDIEALAGRVEAGETGSDTEEAISAILGIIPAGDGWGQMVAGYWEKRDAPSYLTSLDAAARLMPANWAVAVETWPAADDGTPASVKVVARECQPDRKGGPGMWHNPVRNGRADGTAPTECAARVAAGLRAHAHILRKGAK